MARLETLLKNRANAWDNAKKILDERADKDGLLSAEDKAQYDRIMADIDRYTDAIQMEEKAQKIDAEMGKLVDEPVKSAVKESPMNDFVRRKFSNALQEDTNSEGGYLVPVEFERKLVELGYKVDPIFQLATTIVMGAHEKVVPVVASEGAAALIAEEGDYTTGSVDDAYTQKAFKAYKFGKITKVSDELLADAAFDVEGLLAGSFGRSIAKVEAGYFWTGTGSSQPEGVMNGSAAITSASTTSITSDEVLDLYFALGEEYRDNGTFVLGQDAVKLVRKLKDGNSNYIWQPGLNVGQPDTLLGRPLYVSSKIASASAGSKIGVFGDFSYYWIGRRQGFNIKRLNELYAQNGQVGFRGTARADGHPMQSAAFKILALHA